MKVKNLSIKAKNDQLSLKNRAKPKRKERVNQQKS